MPIFDFKCRSCGLTDERLVKSPTVIPRCRTCGGDTDKLLSMPHVVLPASSGFPGKDFRWIREHERAGSSSTTPQSD